MFFIILTQQNLSDDLDHLEDWSDEEALGTEGNTDGASLSLSAKQKKEARGMVIQSPVS